MLIFAVIANLRLASGRREITTGLTSRAVTLISPKPWYPDVSDCVHCKYLLTLHS